LAIQSLGIGTTANDGTGDPLRTGASKINANFTDHETRLAALEGLGALNYRGTWNANSNTPTLTSGAGTKGYLYKVATAGSTALDGASTWYVGDYVLFNGATWDRLDGGNTEVVSVAGRTGAVTLSTTDIGGFTAAAAAAAPVQTVAGRTGTVTLAVADVSGAAPLASPALTGTPTAPTATVGTNTTQVATTAFVLANVGSGGASAALNALLGPVTTPEEFGAVGNGTTDDTAAINSALATLRTVVLSNKRYSVANITVPNNSRMVGFAGSGYTGDTVAGTNRPTLVARAGATSVLNVDGKNRYSFQDFEIHGNGTGARGISGGGTFGYQRNLTILSCSVGFGGYGTTSANYTSVLQSYGCVVGGCTTGIESLVDSLIVGGAVAGGSGTGVSMISGAESNNFVGVRVEWCGGPGYSFFQTKDNQITGGMIDRCSQAGILFTEAVGSTSVSNVLFRRNGASSTTDGTVSTHLAFVNNTNTAARFVVTGCITATGADDGGGGLTTPRNSVSWTGTNVGVLLSGCDLTGFVTAVYNGTAPGTAIINGCRTA
jgi:hypothetical protein